jgi:ParB/RepB/Spo0J family partition protein
MKTTELENIEVSESRQRKTFNKRRMEELSKSIVSNGLFHPIVVEPLDDGGTGTVTLIAGERRLRVVKELIEKKTPFRHDGQEVPLGTIPTVFVDELDEVTRLEIEIEENVTREDFTVQEKAAAYAQLHELRIKQKGEYDKGESQRTGDTVGQTLLATAQEIHGDDAGDSKVKDLSDLLVIAEHLDDPEVAAAKTKSEALKAIKDTKRAKVRKELAEQFDLTEAPHVLFHADSYNLEAVSGAPFDVILADPPYGREMHKEKNAGTRKHNYDDSEEAFQQMLAELPGLCDRLTKPQAHGYIFCDIRRWSELFVAFELSSFQCWPRPLIWDKGNTGSFGDMEYGFRQTYEAILFINKGRRTMAKPHTEVFRCQNPTSGNHAAGKPPELLIELLSCSVLPTNTILDPYCGEGNIFPAATELKCTATGIEKEESTYHMAVATLEALTNNESKE